ncbi:MAG: Wzz/FepE/Etk N-terminal domain-containing protein, partial [Candidatus Hydrogenedentales bacterium]
MRQVHATTPPNHLLLVLERWQIVLLCAVAGAVLAGIVAATRPETYQSSAIVVVTPPPFREPADAPRMEPEGGALLQISELVPPTPPLEALKQLAESPALLADVISTAQLETTARQLGERCEVELSAVRENQRGTEPYSPALLFHVEANESEQAAKILQLWMKIFKARVDELKLAKLDETYRLIHELWGAADTNLADAEDTLEVFEKEWNVPLLRLRLTEKQTMFTQLERDVNDLALKAADKAGAVEKLRETLESEPLTAVLFKAAPEEVYWERINGGAADTVNLGLKHETLNPSHTYVAQLLVDEENALAGLDAQRAAAQEKLAELDAEVVALQSTIATQGLLEARLQRDVNSFTRVLNLASGIRSNVELARLIRASDIFIAGNAPKPQTPVERSVAPLLALGLFAGALIGIAYVFVEALVQDAGRPSA